jgi:hypothetical protein
MFRIYFVNIILDIASVTVPGLDPAVTVSEICCHPSCRCELTGFPTWDMNFRCSFCFIGCLQQIFDEGERWGASACETG